MISNVVCGFIGDKISNPTLLSIAGNVGNMLTFLIIGPLPFLSVEPNIILSIIGLAIFGFSEGLIYVSAFSRAEKAAARNGFDENTRTYQLISGLWIAFDLLGNFLGPALGSIVVEMIGFRYTTLIFWILYLIMLIVDIIEFYCISKQSHMQYAKIETSD